MSNLQKIKACWSRNGWILLCTFLLWGLLSLSAHAATVTVEVANVRNQPAEQAEIIDTLNQGSTVTVTQWAGDWARVEYNSRQGWMNKTVISAQPNQYVTVVEEAVNLRGGQGTSYEIVGSAVKGDKLILLGGSLEWYRVQKMDGTVGYILATLTTREPAATANSESVSNIQEKTYVEITGSVVNLRQGAGTHFAILGSAKAGEFFLWKSTQGDWYEIEDQQQQTAFVAQSVSKLSTRKPDNTVTAAIPATSGSKKLTVYLNGSLLTFPDVAPMIRESRTLVPMRAIFEAMGAEVTWIAESKTVVGVGKDNTVVTLKIGDTNANVNENTVVLDVPAQIVQDRTMVPLRFVGESLGAAVGWDAATYRIDIQTQQKTELLEPMPSVEPTTVVEPVAAVEPTAVIESVAAVEPTTVIEPVASVEPTTVIEPVAAVEPTTVVEPTLVVEPTPIVQPTGILLNIETKKNELGFNIILSSQQTINPAANKEDNVLKLDFTGYYLSAAVHVTQKLGGGELKVDAENHSQGVLVQVTMPENVECQFDMSEDGRTMSLVIENHIRNIGRKVYGETDELVIIDTVVPVKYQYLVNERIMELVLSNTSMGIAKEEYTYYGSVMKTMKIKEVESEEGKEVHLTLEANQDCKFNTLLTEEGVLNIAVTAYKEEDIFTPVSDHLVMLDAGHGGTEKGAIYGGIDERFINMAIVAKLGAYLQNKGVDVLYTRTSDTTVSLSERSDMANHAKVAAFISVHCNAATNTAAYGAETYFYAPISNPALFSQRMERQTLAQMVQKQLTAATGAFSRGVKESNLAVLRGTQMPSILVECAFISNDEERSKLQSEGFQQQLARGIGDGIIEYLNQSNRTLTVTPN